MLCLPTGRTIMAFWSCSVVLSKLTFLIYLLCKVDYYYDGCCYLLKDITVPWKELLSTSAVGASSSRAELKYLRYSRTLRSVSYEARSRLLGVLSGLESIKILFLLIGGRLEPRLFS